MNPIENDDGYTSCITHGRTFITCDIATIIHRKKFLLFVGCLCIFTLIRHTIRPKIEDISKQIQRGQRQKAEYAIHCGHIRKVVTEGIFTLMRQCTCIRGSRHTWSMNNVFDQPHITEHQHSAKNGTRRIMAGVCDKRTQHEAVNQAL